MRYEQEPADRGRTSHPAGVSVIICCHNAAARLEPTIRHLSAQEAAERFPWEVLVIDNASTDGTADVARAAWPAPYAIPLRVIREEMLGLSHARACGLREARYEYISFVDDDNWVSPQWVETVYAIFDQHPEVAVCGGAIEAVPEIEPPAWFARYQRAYAVGELGCAAKYVPFDALWGAGLCLRRQAWRQLREAGFVPCLVGRRGKSLTAGEDSEICAALSILGWKLWYDPRLRLKHFIPAGRLTWRYARRLGRGFGHANVALGRYRGILSPKRGGWREELRRTWIWQVLAAVRTLLAGGLALRGEREGAQDQFEMEFALGRAQALLAGFSSYRKNARQVQALSETLSRLTPLVFETRSTGDGTHAAASMRPDR